MGDFAAIWSDLLKIFPILNGEVSSKSLIADIFYGLFI